METAYCLRVSNEQTLASIAFSAGDAVMAYATAPSDLMMPIDMTIPPIESFTWYVVRSPFWSAVAFNPAAGKTLQLSPDGSRAVVPVDLYAYPASFRVLDTLSGDEVCAFSLSLDDDRCTAVLQANGDLWNVPQSIQLTP